MQATPRSPVKVHDSSLLGSLQPQFSADKEVNLQTVCEAAGLEVSVSAWWHGVPGGLSRSSRRKQETWLRAVLAHGLQSHVEARLLRSGVPDAVLRAGLELARFLAQDQRVITAWSELDVHASKLSGTGSLLHNRSSKFDRNSSKQRSNFVSEIVAEVHRRYIVRTASCVEKELGQGSLLLTPRSKSGAEVALEKGAEEQAELALEKEAADKVANRLSMDLLADLPDAQHGQHWHKSSTQQFPLSLLQSPSPPESAPHMKTVRRSSLEPHINFMSKNQLDADVIERSKSDIPESILGTHHHDHGHHVKIETHARIKQKRHSSHHQPRSSTFGSSSGRRSISRTPGPVEHETEQQPPLGRRSSHHRTSLSETWKGQGHKKHAKRRTLSSFDQWTSQHQTAEKSMIIAKMEEEQKRQAVEAKRAHEIQVKRTSALWLDRALGFASQEPIMDMGQVRRIFASFDEDQSGSIEPKEFVPLLAKCLKTTPDSLDMKEVWKVWEEMDEDGSGAVEFDEFHAWYSSLLEIEMYNDMTEFITEEIVPDEEKMIRNIAREIDKSVLEVEMLWTQFNILDADGSGILEFEEFEELIQKQLSPNGPPVPHRVVEKLWLDLERTEEGLPFKSFAKWYLSFMTGNKSAMEQYYSKLAAHPVVDATDEL
mmetsp:Transcript_17601/g.30835  ORF Transcript_17601/g.30835 Transcript_17601/m.30835 type:complete len:655 (-) Transcript_17601:100-2064(-)|eukprot:CAMPEP_0197641180 /NCGR_PEP_ID=MMETSP1338-20131121/15220_1 /TAXON_ID=43686 ORGANISM="Pelagodinium beii, Strain RCC1491" /NCGR_SAMPLE_ID=MMETSP1338 /ASSEMBLY_ACC=CAM_ASM_000754 /LENGTH=654 /DNA_ID=CAMNT_0043214117 /DNA_START=66 /DNA_END=2030 /DNA_ORIENTATION=+